MSLIAFNYGANIVAFRKGDNNYGMCCSWATQVDYDKLCLLIGQQSVTGNNIEVGDIIGVSSLSTSQKLIAENFGEGHSDQVDKFIDLDYILKEQAILIDRAKVRMIVKVVDIIRLEGIEADKMIYGKIIEYKENETLEFLHM